MRFQMPALALAALLSIVPISTVFPDEALRMENRAQPKLPFTPAGPTVVVSTSTLIVIH